MGYETSLKNKKKKKKKISIFFWNANCLFQSAALRHFSLPSFKRKRLLKAELQKHIPLWQIPPGRLFCECHAFLTLEGVGEVENASNKLGTCFTNGFWPHDSFMTALWNISAYFLLCACTWVNKASESIIYQLFGYMYSNEIR
ncbi:hypothetical protein T4A_9036 [Trichinella pseudospiralis]|uniref:Uncharacterized protein n=1 Tax=Trichinella pseudospiralis TaxID=6337 RepID=A0A0V1EVD6_TRIPS|nr:hypothetical protein T4A_9036 [Trichinella pseudospiralis]